MITVKVIVAGFLSAVPHDKDQGATILLRDAWGGALERANSGDEEPPLRFHVPILLLQKGRCESGCAGPPALPWHPKAKKAVAQALGDRSDDQLNPKAHDLIWIPAGRDVAFKNDTRKPGKSSSRKDVFKLLEGGWKGTSEVDPRCMSKEGCKAAVSRLRVPGSSINPACYVQCGGHDAVFKTGRLALDDDDKCIVPEKGRGSRRRLAEEQVIEFQVEGKHLVIKGTEFEGRSSDEKNSIQAVILPEGPAGKREIVLFLGNVFLGSKSELDPSPCQPDDDRHPHLVSALQHYAALYDLAVEKTPCEKRKLPVFDGYLSKESNSALCEEVLSYRPIFKRHEESGVILNYPHNPLACPPGASMDEK